MAGTPEISLMNFMIGQMARHYNVPWRTSNTLGGAKIFDAQAGYESAATMMAVLLAGANYLWQARESGDRQCRITLSTPAKCLFCLTARLWHAT